MTNIHFHYYNIVYLSVGIILIIGLIFNKNYSGLNCIQTNDCSELYLMVTKPQIKPTGKCPTKAVITFTKIGRLGNQISTYINLLAIQNQFGLVAHAPKNIINRVKLLFTNVTIPSIESINHCNIIYKNISSSFSIFMKKNTDCVEKSRRRKVCFPSQLEGGEGIWIQKGHTGPRFEVIHPVQTALLQHHMQLESVVKKAAMSSIQALRSSSATVVVGIHVRRTDYFRLMDGKPFIGSDYIRDAGKKFIDKFAEVVFAVFSDDLDWCRNNINLPNTHFIGSDSPRTSASIEDLSKLSSCDHAILTTSSTFGMWGAFLTRGQVILPASATFRYKYFKDYLNWTVLPVY